MTEHQVVVLGTTALNGGDAALLLAQLQVLEDAFHPTRITVFDQHQAATQTHYPELEVRSTLTWPHNERMGSVGGKARWVLRIARLFLSASAMRSGRMRWARHLAPSTSDLESLECYREATVACAPGGTMLVDNYNFVPRLADWMLPVILRRPLVLFTQTLGAFDRRLPRVLAGFVLRRATLVLVRGEDSARRARALGVRPDRVRVAPDPAFALAAFASPRERRGAAISVRDLPFFAGANTQSSYEAAIARLCVHLVERHDFNVVFVSTCQGATQYWTDDSRVADRIVAALPDATQARVVVDHGYHRPERLRDRYGEFELVVATRLHAAILALDAGTPTVAIAYEHKTNEVFERLGMPELVVSIDTVDARTLTDLADLVLGMYAEYVDRIQDAVRAETEAAAEVADALREAIERDHGSARS
jgi:colanic acid/amylovoran biosynthesis protein